MNNFVFVVFLTSTGLAICYGQSTCCLKGNNLADVIVRSTGKMKCSVDERRGKFSDDEMKNFMCQYEFEQCCGIRATSQVCQRGKEIARSGQNCLNVAETGIKASQQSCCQCCKRGQLAGQRGESCEQIMTQANKLLTDLCSLSYKECCVIEKEKRVTKCKDIKCGENTSGCKDTKSGAQCECLVGYQRQTSTQCVDLNECSSEETNRCPRKSYCLNTDGDYKCYLNCPSPNYNKTAPRICEDVDECQDGRHSCKPEVQQCINHLGGYRCKQIKCEKGLVMIDEQCRDIDECTETVGICGKGKCMNRYGGYYCQCDRGYRFDRTTCIDRNECNTNRHYCSYKCENTIGGYNCVCPKGYKLTGKRCVDEDECEKTDSCAKGLYCLNTAGSFMCITQACPDPTYYVQTAVKGEPDKCERDCKEAPKIKKRVCQLGSTPRAIKRITYRYIRSIRPRGFIYNYWWQFPSDKYLVQPRIVKGNDGGEFYIEMINDNQAKVVNTKKITGPKKYKVVMHTDVRERILGEPLVFRYIYEFYVDVSKHNF